MESKFKNSAFVLLILAGSLAGACFKFAMPIPNIELLLPFLMAAGMLAGNCTFVFAILPELSSLASKFENRELFGHPLPRGVQ